MNKLEPNDINFIYDCHLTLTTCSHYVYRDETYGIQMEQIVKRDGHGWSGTPKNYYFIDNVDREFISIETLCECWNERNNFDDPDTEIVWEKKIVPIKKLK